MIIKCKMCGGDIEFTPGATYGTCEYCGSTSTIPQADDEQKLNRYNRANHFRQQCEFDKALNAYEKLLEQDDNDAEAHWGAVISRFGIEYVEDPATKKRIPTCHRVQVASILADADYLAAVEHAPDETSRELYKQQAAEIAEIQKGILAISANEKPYDVFICYKETDADGQRTHDSQWAQDIYYGLTEQGYKVFFSRITLEEKLGQQYEPYIFAALNSAKVMVVVGSKPEYFNAVWVKNEWSRYLALMKTDHNRLLIPCYRDMDPYDLPEELSMLQSQNMSKIGFIQDLLRGVKKVLDAGQKAAAPVPAAVPVAVPAQAANANATALVKRGYMALTDMDWNAADHFFDEALNLDAELSDAYLGRFLVTCKEPNMETLDKNFKAKLSAFESIKETIFLPSNMQAEISKWIDMCNPILPGNTVRSMFKTSQTYEKIIYDVSMHEKEVSNLKKDRNLQRAIQFAPSLQKDKLQRFISGWDDTVKANMEKANNQSSANENAAKNKLQKDFETASSNVQTSYTQQMESQYKAACLHQQDAKEQTSIGLYLRAESEFLRLGKYKDSMDRAAACKCESIELENRNAQAKAYMEYKRKKKIAIWFAIAIFCVAACAAIYFIPPIFKYNRGIALRENGNYANAIAAFTSLGSYKDSEEQIQITYYAVGVAQREMQHWDNAIAAFSKTGNYKDSATQIKATCYAEGEAKRDVADWAGAIEAFTSAGDYEDSIAQITETKYQQAKSLMEAKDYLGAATIFITIRDYKDVEALLVKDDKMIEATVEAKSTVGNYVTFGSYPQTADGDDMTAIEWLVLAREGKKVLLISRYGLDAQKYHSENTDITWQTCSLRTWLNSTFLNKAFTATEQSAILKTTVDNSTQDKVFLLSYEEANKYLGITKDGYYNEKFRVEATAYAKERGAHISVDNAIWWWLRSPRYADKAPYVTPGGYTDSTFTVYSSNAIRPALWVNLESGIF